MIEALIEWVMQIIFGLTCKREAVHKILFAMASYRYVGLGLAASLLFVCASLAQISGNIVGYYTKVIYAGDNLIANQLSFSNNLLSEILRDVPEGSTFTKWDPVNLEFLPRSVYTASGGWSMDYSLTYGEGGLLYTPVTFTNLFVGDVWPGFEPGEPFVPPLIASNGYFLLSCVVPIPDATFSQVVGREPQEAEYVARFNPVTQTYFTTRFRNGAWDNGPPLLQVGEAAFFNLGPVVVPEPMGLSVGGIGLVFLCRLARGSRH